MAEQADATSRKREQASLQAQQHELQQKHQLIRAMQSVAQPQRTTVAEGLKLRHCKILQYIYIP